MDPQQQQPNPNPQYTAPVTPDGSQNSNSNQFTPTESPKPKKNGLLVIGIIVAVIIVAVVAVLAMGSDKKDDTSKISNSNSSSNSNGDTANASALQKYDVTDKKTGAKYSVLFYKDATVTDKNGYTYLISGELGSQRSITVVATQDTGKIDCQGSESTTMTLVGQSTTVCYKSDNTRYAGNGTSKNTGFQLSLAGQKAISMEDAKAILESITFN
jgi:hypothetical protein